MAVAKEESKVLDDDVFLIKFSCGQDGSDNDHPEFNVDVRPALAAILE